MKELYEKALSEQGSVDVAYGRVMLLGSAGVGKTALKRSLMEELFDPNIASTIVSDVSAVRPTYDRSFEHEYHTMIGETWKQVTEDDEIDEICLLLNKTNRPSAPQPIVTELYPAVTPMSNCIVADDLQVNGFKENQISSILSKAPSHDAINILLGIKQQEIIQPFLHIWDCGGQPVFLEILPAFLTSHTMFLLLFDASRNLTDKWQSVENIDGQQSFEEEISETTGDLMLNWMSTIYGHLMKKGADGRFYEYPRLYCIGTHGDKLVTEEKKKKVKENLESLYDGNKAFAELIEDALIVDNTTSGRGKDEDPNLTKLRKAIGVFVREKLIVKTPVNWVLFRKVLQSLKKNVIEIAEAYAVGVACQIPPADVPKVLMFYHEIGAYLFYPHIKGLQNKVIINPKWFVDTLGKVFTLKGREDVPIRLRNMLKLLREKGILVQPFYVKVWKESNNDINPEDMISLLVDFHLAAKVHTDEYHDHDAKQYFVPAVLKGFTGNPSQAPPGHKLRATPLHITFSTGFSPPGYFTRLATTIAKEYKLVFDCGIYRNRVSFDYGQPPLDHLTLTDIRTAIQVDILRYAPETSAIPPFTNVCQDLVNVLEKCCKEVEDILYNSHSDILDQSPSYLPLVPSRKFYYVCTQCQSDDLHYLKIIKETCALPVACQRNRIHRSLIPEETLWFKRELPVEYPPPSLEQQPTEISGATGQDISQPKRLTRRPSVEEAHQLLAPVQHQWDLIGYRLGVQDGKVSEIRHDTTTCSRRLREVLNYWLRKMPYATWQDIIDALVSLDYVTLAEEIRMKL